MDATSASGDPTGAGASMGAGAATNSGAAGASTGADSNGAGAMQNAGGAGASANSAGGASGAAGAATSPDDPGTNGGTPSDDDMLPDDMMGAGAEGNATAAGASNMDDAAGGADPGMAGAAGDDTGETIEAADQYSAEVQLASDIEPSAPGTIGIVTWSIEGVTPTDAYVEFGLDESYGTQAPVDLDEDGFRTLLLGMKPDQTYNFRIVASDGATSYQSGNYTVDTGPATTAVSIADFNVISDATRERGFFVISYWQGAAASVIFILDADGEIVWWYDTGTMGTARARMSADGKNMWMVVPTNGGGGPVQRVSMDTLDGQTYDGNDYGSHDLTAVSGETMAYLNYEGSCDKITLIDPSGDTSLVWDTQEWWDSVGGNGMCHSNALRYSATEDVFTLSEVSTDIFVVDRGGTIQWQLADRVSGGVQSWGGRNHGHHLLDDSMLVFANEGGEGMGVSAMIEYDLEGNEINRYDSGEGSANLGDVQRLPGGNTLITYSNSGIIHEIDPDNNLVLSIDSGGSAMGYTMWRETLYGPAPDLGL